MLTYATKIRDDHTRLLDERLQMEDRLSKKIQESEKKLHVFLKEQKEAAEGSDSDGSFDKKIKANNETLYRNR